MVYKSRIESNKIVCNLQQILLYIDFLLISIIYKRAQAYNYIYMNLIMKLCLALKLNYLTIDLNILYDYFISYLYVIYSSFFLLSYSIILFVDFYISIASFYIILLYSSWCFYLLLLLFLKNRGFKKSILVYSLKRRFLRLNFFLFVFVKNQDYRDIILGTMKTNKEDPKKPQIQKEEGELDD